MAAANESWSGEIPTTETETVPPQREGDGENGWRPANAEERKLGDGSGGLRVEDVEEEEMEWGRRALGLI